MWVVGISCRLRENVLPKPVAKSLIGRSYCKQKDGEEAGMQFADFTSFIDSSLWMPETSSIWQLVQ